MVTRHSGSWISWTALLSRRIVLHPKGFDTVRSVAVRAPSPCISSCGVNVRIGPSNGAEGRIGAWLRGRRPASGQVFEAISEQFDQNKGPSFVPLRL
jgi:hypothetical protein